MGTIIEEVSDGKNVGEGMDVQSGIDGKGTKAEGHPGSSATSDAPVPEKRYAELSCFYRHDIPLPEGDRFTARVLDIHRRADNGFLEVNVEILDGALKDCEITAIVDRDHPALLNLGDYIEDTTGLDSKVISRGIESMLIEQFTSRECQAVHSKYCHAFDLYVETTDHLRYDPSEDLWVKMAQKVGIQVVS